MTVNRRTVLRGLAGVGASTVLGAACSSSGPGSIPLTEAGSATATTKTPSQPVFTGVVAFAHGVASGDPLADRVILWTRVSGAPADAVVPVRWRISATPALDSAVVEGETTATADGDFTVKVDAAGLAPATTYYYRFVSGQVASPVGRTRTLPLGPVERVRLGVVNCGNYAAGYFPAYEHVGRRADLHAVLHLGDLIYQNGETPFDRPPGGFVRRHRLGEEAVSLSDYRDRYGEYREDVQLQAMLRQHPLIAVWDDHEFANNAWRGGSETHLPQHGDWSVRRAAAARAWHEWVPVRPQADPLRIWRPFAFGELVDLLMLDARLYGREDPSNGDRSLLGAEQRAWLEGELTASAGRGSAWRVLGQQVLFAPVMGDGRNDSWDGAATEREQLLGYLRDRSIADTVVLTGDIHTSLANEVPQLSVGDPSVDEPVVVELVAPPASSDNGFDFLPGVAAEGLQVANPWLRWVELAGHGWLELDLTLSSLQADFYFVDTVAEPSTESRFVKGFVVARGSARLTEVGAAIVPDPGAPVLAP